MKLINLDTSSYDSSYDTSRSLNMSSHSTSSQNTSSPLRCRLSGRTCCQRSCRHTRRYRFSSPTTRRSSHQQLSEYAFAGGDRRFGNGGLKKARAGRIVTGVVVVSAIAAVLALFSIDLTRAVIFNASLGGGGGSPPAAQLAAAVPEPAQPQRIAAPPLAAEPTGAEVAAARRSPPNALASALPTRDEIAAAYQSALKGTRWRYPSRRRATLPSRSLR